jgi:hypothetical protein
VSFTEWDRHLKLAAAAKGYETALTVADDPSSGKLMYLIQSTLDSVRSAMTSDCRSAKAMYDVLKAAYQASSTAAAQDLRRQYHSARQEEQEDVAVYAARIKGMASDLAAAGVVISPQDQSSTFLHGLTAAFETQVTITLNGDGDLPSIANLLPKMMHIEAAKSRDAPKPVTACALITARGTNSSSGGYNNGNGFNTGGSPTYRHSSHQKCLFCDKPGHDIAVCRKMFAAKTEQQQASRSQSTGHAMFAAGMRTFAPF